MDIDLLSKMVKELIMDQDRVVLPGLGSFVAEIVPSTFSDKGYTINPPYRRLFFRAKPDDGDDLTAFYAAYNKVDPQMAERIIRDFLTDLKAVLYEKKTVVFPGLGRLRATKENHIFFVADEDLDIYPEGFGLEPISLKTHQETPEQVAAAVSGLRSLIEDNSIVSADDVVPVPVSEPEPVSVSEAEAEPEPEPVQTIISEPDQVTENLPVSEPELELNPEPKVESDPKLEQEPDTKSEPESEPELELEMESEPDIEPEFETIHELEPAPEPTSELSPEPTSEQEPAPMPVPELEPMPEPMPEPKLEKEIDPEPEPAETVPVYETRRKPWWKTLLKIVLWLVVAAVVLLAAFIICSQMAPDFIDSLLYTPEEMDIVKLL
jgi:nucleoid DNA-binding protein